MGIKIRFRIRKMSKTCLHISFAIILTLFVVNLNANPKPKADNGIDIIINRVGPMVGPRMFGLQKPDTGAGHRGPNRFWIPSNPGPEYKEIGRPACCKTCCKTEKTYERCSLDSSGSYTRI